MAVAVALPDPQRMDAEQSIELLPLNSIKPAPDNPRKQLGDIAELAQSMNELGMLQPLVVTPRDGSFMVVCGHRRYAAAAHAKLGLVPAIVRELSDPQRIKAMLIENCQRTDLTALEEARAYQGLVDLDMSQREIARDVGKSQPHISKRLSLLELPGNVLKAVDADGITIGDALELLKLKEHPNRLGAAFGRRGQHFHGIEGAIAEQLRELELEQKTAAAVARLKKQGVTIIEYRRSEYRFDPPKGAIEVSKDASWGNAFKLDPKEHAKHPCHAAAVHPRDGKVEFFCTDRKNHPKLKTEDEKRSGRRTPAKSAARANHDKEIREARRTRVAFIQQLLAKPPAKNELVDIFVAALIRECWQSKRKLACELLGLDTEPYSKIKRSRYGYAEKWQAALEAHAKERGGAVAVGLALVLASDEECIGKAWDGWKDHAAHFDYLAQHGYKITPAEKRELTGKRPR